MKFENFCKLPDELKFKLLGQVLLDSVDIPDRFVDWTKLCESNEWTVDLAIAKPEYMNWNAISRFQRLDESFIERFQDKVNWAEVSIYQNLSESFIKKFQDKVDWYSAKILS